jgi:hypothetical protein
MTRYFCPGARFERFHRFSPQALFHAKQGAIIPDHARRPG